MNSLLYIVDNHIDEKDYAMMYLTVTYSYNMHIVSAFHASRDWMLLTGDVTSCAMTDANHIDGHLDI